ncbi:bifunctional nitrate reductase/sulfite reductase flavoprotein subunit alpha [Pseudomonas rubra]|uniref:Bifunctional nitrate reductase/sulfite reductase flavoprotein subunit alpha n=1 Tax=Pseudomonas rubra TaxID=2942627 RepID=A0ABT5P5K4_9PSED|nr:bifunctional nitrate reductase/sulfite reductase flavoprotein subunit alpha [Pseudomonas rubra]MDD1013569.1 bifunctional nitrate reductase/sulfite reductase flavoprotein subunit alpha [Pseudomonas rubra]MDD1040113.1 bifunctional nitrate reductase/sulfite reductase flavoprotein subunit alpha [Pseudomonas rubra]MDD1155881.1 bifunctional nitrate reductase/sulfite reductase flavoprotein subunit alpha [Pseudomonas rubra]
MSSTSVRSVCPYCGVGCGIVMSVEDGRVTKVTGDKQHPSNFGRLCTKGLTAHQPLRESGRMEHAYVRDLRQRDPVQGGIDTAIEQAALRLRAIIDEHGPDALGFYVSGQMSLEAQYLINKLAKGFVRSRHIESNSRLCMASASSGYKLSLGADGPPGSYQDFDHAEVFLVIGANMADCHPILFLRLLDRLKAGARLIVVDPRQNATADKADLFLQIKPGTDLALLNGLLHLLLENGQCDADFIQRYTEGWDAMPAFLADYTPQRVAAITGLHEADIRQAAQWIGRAPQWMSCWTMGLNQSIHGTWQTNALCNLHLATGAICRPGSGPFSLTGQPNAMGGREMGYMGPGLPGQRSALVAADRAFVEQLWQIPAGSLRSEAGDGTVALFGNLASGQVKACWIICSNPVASVANRQQVIDGLQAAQLVIAQDAFLDTETNRYADILLPAALWAEGEGVMVNSERNLTLMNQAVQAPGESLPDWQIIARVACAMGYAEAFSYASAEAVFDELRQAWNPATGYDVRGVSYTRLRKAPQQWPCEPGRADDRSPLRYRNDGRSQALLRDAYGEAPAIAFPTDSGKARFFARPCLPAAERPDADFPLVLNTGRVQHQWHTLTKTGKVAALNKLDPGPFVEIHPEDAQRLGIVEKDQVQVRSRRGQALLPALITTRVLPGNCFAPFHWNDVYGDHLAINAVTSDAVDPLSLQPAFKYCTVALSRVAGERIDATQLDHQPVSVQDKHLLLWASQTGNGQALAEQCAERLRQVGLPVHLSCMQDLALEQLDSPASLLLIASTFGDGDAPDSGAAFWRGLHGEHSQRCAGLPYAVLALGDSSYEQFCGFGRKLDQRLAELGAERLLERVDCEGDFNEPAGQWLQALLGKLGHGQLLLEAPVPVPTNTGFSKTRPLATTLVGNRLLNGPGAVKETRQLVFDLGQSGFTYQAGDALGVWPRNCPALVDELLTATRFDGSRSVSLKGQADMPLADALQEHLEIARITAPLLEAFALGDTQLRELLAPHNKAALKAWLWGKQLIDLVHLCKPQLSLDTWLSLLKPLQPRLYSISSSQMLHPDQVHLTVSTVRYSQRKGVCSTYLADRSEPGRVDIFTQPTSHFRLPGDSTAPVIMVGPGTGVAPFRAFLQERQAQGATGRNWLLFGEQQAATDFYYRDELLAWQRDGHLTRLDTAFSRDQAQKIYVQQRMLEQGAELWRWLEEGGHFYICGDAERMARDVDAALKQVVHQYGGMSVERAEAYVGELSRAKRYLRDVY